MTLKHLDLSQLSVILLLLAMLILATANSRIVLGDSINPGTYATDSKPLGMTYEDWTIKFWQWLLPIPSDRNPMADMNGGHCGEGQGALPVFFLAPADKGSVQRACNIPSGKAILVPVNIVECSFKELNVKTEQDLKKCATEDESSDPGLFLSVDGKDFKELQKYRIATRAFDVSFPKNGIFGVNSPGPSRAVSDGYWVMLEPLSPGKHQIHFHATLTDPTTQLFSYNAEVKYNINVS